MRFLIGILLCAFFTSNAQADRALFFEPAQQAEQAYQDFEQTALSSADWTVHQNFRKVLLALSNDEFSDLSEGLEELRFVAGSRGYSDLPDYSLELLRKAASQKDLYKTKFLVDKAVELSPSDSRVAFTAASFYEQIGLGKALGLVFGAISNIFSQPLFLALVLINLVVLILVSLTMAVFFAYLIQMLRNANLIREALFPVLPWKHRGVLSLAALLFLYFAPFCGGILVVLLVWGICLGAILGRRYLLIIGMLCVLWGGLLPRISKVAYNVNDPSSRVFEDLNLSRFSPKAEQYLQKDLAENPNDATSLFFLAQTFRLKGLSDSAGNLFTRVDMLSGVESKLKKVSRANLGVVAFDDGKYSKALELLSEAEQSGMRGFEIYYNLAITNLLLLNTDHYTKYYNLAKDIAPGKVSQIVNDKYISPKAILIPVPAGAMLKPLFNPISTLDPIELKSAQDKFAKAASILAGGISSNLILVIGILLSVAAINFKSKKFTTHLISKAWTLFPFGRYLASTQIFFGIIGLSFLICILLLAPSGPLELYADYVSFKNLYKDFLFLVIPVLLLVQWLSIYTINGKPNER